MYELKVKNHIDEILNLSTHSGYEVYKIDGLQPPAVNINRSKNATSDGDTVNSMSANSRNIVIYIAIKGDVETNRINLYRYFPLKKTIELYFKNGTRNVHIEGLVELIECDIFTNMQVAQISIICPQPYFKDVTELVSYFNEISALFTFPFSIAASGMELSTITTNIRKAIINTGDVDTGLIISLYAIGEVVNPVIYDVFNRTHIKLNITLKASDQVIINTNVGKKSITLIRDGSSINIMGYMQPDCKWLTLAVGDNVYTYDADSGVSNMQLTFSTALLYGGV